MLKIYMWQFIMGFGVGVYVGTKYDCKPTINFVRTCIKNNVPSDLIPKEKNSKDNE